MDLECLVGLLCPGAAALTLSHRIVKFVRVLPARDVTAARLLGRSMTG